MWFATTTFVIAVDSTISSFNVVGIDADNNNLNNKDSYETIHGTYTGLYSQMPQITMWKLLRFQGRGDIIQNIIVTMIIIIISITTLTIIAFTVVEEDY